MDYFNKNYVYPGLDNEIVIKGILSIVNKNKLSFKNNNYNYFVNGARHSIYLACIQSKRKSSYEVIVPLFTCCVVVSAIIEAGCKPIFYNNTWDYFQGSFNEINNLINEKTCLIVLQSTFGYSSNSLAKNLKTKHNSVPILDDRAHGDNDLGEGNIEPYDFLAYSFEQSKIITCGKGGLLISKKSLKQGLIKPVNFLLDFRDILFLIISYVELILMPKRIGKILYKFTWRIFFIKRSMSRKEIELEGLETPAREMSQLKISFLYPQIKSLDELKKKQLNFLKMHNLPFKNIEKVCTQYIYKKNYIVNNKTRDISINGWFSNILHPSPIIFIKKLIKEKGYKKTKNLSDNKLNIILSRRLLKKY